MSDKIHHGRNIKRFREMMGIKQEALAFELGEDWSQKKISLLEQKEEIEEILLRRLRVLMRKQFSILSQILTIARVKITRLL
jgi:hypothetical protein